jgi:hypothetical protein
MGETRDGYSGQEAKTRESFAQNLRNSHAPPGAFFPDTG